MTALTSRAATREAVRSVLAADCACPASAFVADGLLITPFEERPGRRRYPIPTKELRVITMGRGVVVSCHSDWVTPLHALLDNLERDEIFAPPSIAELSQFVARDGGTLLGRSLSFVCAPESLRRPVNPDGFDVSVFEGEAVRDLYQYPGFGFALSYDPTHSRPDIAAAVARRAGEIVGIAGMSADCDTLWQIGIEVVPNARGAGVGRSLVSRLTELAFQQNCVPSYSAAVTNLRSQALAVSLGYWPAWIECFVRDTSPT